MTEPMPILVPLRNPADLVELKAAAAADAHEVICPTHIVRKSGELVGYFSILAAPTAYVWLDSKRVRPRDSFSLLNTATNIAIGIGNPDFLVVGCDSGSPFASLMPSMGYVHTMNTHLYVKKVRQ